MVQPETVRTETAQTPRLYSKGIPETARTPRLEKAAASTSMPSVPSERNEARLSSSPKQSPTLTTRLSPVPIRPELTLEQRLLTTPVRSPAVTHQSTLPGRSSVQGGTQYAALPDRNSLPFNQFSPYTAPTSRHLPFFYGN